MQALPQIRVVVVDDHHMVRDGLRSFLSLFADIAIVGEAADGAEALPICATLQPDVVLVDIIMPRHDGCWLIRALSQRQPPIKCIALTSFTDTRLVEDAMAAGAVGFLLKDVDPEDLAIAIRRAYRGDAALGAHAMRILMRKLTAPPRPSGHLTRRELQVLNLIAAGRPNAEIGEQLTISLSTVSYHVTNILAKLGAANRTEAARLAIDSGLTQIGGPTAVNR